MPRGARAGLESEVYSYSFEQEIGWCARAGVVWTRAAGRRIFSCLAVHFWCILTKVVALFFFRSLSGGWSSRAKFELFEPLRMHAAGKQVVDTLQVWHLYVSRQMELDDACVNLHRCHLRQLTDQLAWLQHEPTWKCPSPRSTSTRLRHACRGSPRPALPTVLGLAFHFPMI